MRGEELPAYVRYAFLNQRCLAYFIYFYVSHSTALPPPRGLRWCEAQDKRGEWEMGTLLCESIATLIFFSIHHVVPAHLNNLQ